MQHQVHPDVVLLANSVASDPKQGAQIYANVRKQLRTTAPLDVQSKHAIEAIQSIGSKRDLVDLSSDLISRLSAKISKSEELGYRTVLGAAWDNLAVLDRRGSLSPRDKVAQVKLREFFHPKRGYASGSSGS